MKKLLIGVCLLIPTSVFSCPILEGTWTSSLENFETFNKRWANVDSNAWSYMLQTQGHEKITFKDNKSMRIVTPPLTLKMGDKQFEQPALEEHIDFTILGCTDNTIALKYTRNGKLKISHLHFENETTFWEYMGAAGSSGNGHIREFYTKILE